VSAAVATRGAAAFFLAAELLQDGEVADEFNLRSRCRQRQIYTQQLAEQRRQRRFSMIRRSSC
jgi:hypothetical protein